MFLDKKYINLLSPTLERFSWKKENLSSCRCPICGDSRKNKSKTRFFFFQDKTGNWFVKCHNCDYSNSFERFLEHINPGLYKDYRFDKFQEFSSSRSDRSNFYKKFDKNSIKQHTEHTNGDNKILPNCMSIKDLCDLPDSEKHPAIRFFYSRKINLEFSHTKLFYTDDFHLFAKSFVPGENKFPHDPRIIMPYYNKQGVLTYIQGRSLDPTNNLRYCSISLGYEHHLFGCNGLDETKTIYVVEGPFDSLFLSNAIAVGGSGFSVLDSSGLPKEKIVVVYDNEPRNKEICRKMNVMISKGYRICIWPTSIKYKDINDMVLGDIHDPQSIIDANTYHGIKAKIRLAEWRKS